MYRMWLYIYIYIYTRISFTASSGGLWQFIWQRFTQDNFHLSLSLCAPTIVPDVSIILPAAAPTLEEDSMNI